MKNHVKSKARGKSRKSKRSRYFLRLYVTGQTARSMQSVENLRALCEKYLRGRFDLEVVDIYQQPAMAAAGQIIAAPEGPEGAGKPPRLFMADGRPFGNSGLGGHPAGHREASRT